MLKEIEKRLSEIDTSNRYYMCKLLRPAGKFLQIIKNEVRHMSWNKTSITVTLANDKYPKNRRRAIFNNIVQDPTAEQINLFVSGLLLLSDGDTHLGTEVTKHDELTAE